MQIVHRITDFLYSLFPSVKAGDVSALKTAIQNYYTLDGDAPDVQIEHDIITITFDDPQQVFKEQSFKKAVAFCELGDYDSAKPILEELIKDNPTHSEYYRILGQAYAEQGKQDEAIDYLIEALRWNPKNASALLMMGNIFAQYKNDVETALLQLFLKLDYQSLS